MIADESLRATVRAAIAAQLPEDEPDTIPDWCCDTIINTVLEHLRERAAKHGEVAAPPQVSEQEDGAGLIHQVARPITETEPRPDSGFSAVPTSVVDVMAAAGKWELEAHRATARAERAEATMRFACACCQRVVADAVPVCFTVPGIPAVTYYFCSALCRERYLHPEQPQASPEAKSREVTARRSHMSDQEVRAIARAAIDRADQWLALSRGHVNGIDARNMVRELRAVLAQVTPAPSAHHFAIGDKVMMRDTAPAYDAAIYTVSRADAPVAVAGENRWESVGVVEAERVTENGTLIKTMLHHSHWHPAPSPEPQERMTDQDDWDALSDAIERGQKSRPSPSSLMADAAEALWGVVANVDASDWSLQNPDWQVAASRARDLYHKALDAAEATRLQPPSAPVEPERETVWLVTPMSDPETIYQRVKETGCTINSDGSRSTSFKQIVNATLEAIEAEALRRINHDDFDTHDAVRNMALRDLADWLRQQREGA